MYSILFFFNPSHFVTALDGIGTIFPGPLGFVPSPESAAKLLKISAITVRNRVHADENISISIHLFTPFAVSNILIIR